VDKKFKRRHILLVDRTFQYPFMARFSVAVVGGIVLAFLTLGVYYFMTYSSSNLAMKFFYITGEPGTGLKQTTLFSLVWPPLVIAGLLSVVLTLTFGLVYSHRIAGPLYHLKRVLREIREGKMVDEVRFREGDEFHDLAEEITRTILWFREKLGRRR